MRYLPIHIDTKDQSIFVAGGGRAAEAKLRTLLKTDAQLTVFAEVISCEIKKWHDESKINWLKRNIKAEDIENARLIYAATDDPRQNHIIAILARQKSILVNAADQKEDCDFFTPALVDRDPVIISIGTEGTAPGLARAIKADLESRLPSQLGLIANKVQWLRRKISCKVSDISLRQKFWAGIFSDTSLEGRTRLSAEDIEQKATAFMAAPDMPKIGHVSLVGAGPGSAELLTLGARQKLHSADVIVYDRLVSQEILDFGRREAEYIYVGKTPGGASASQEDINQILIREARKGHFVVRLKSGDPLIFGRADEEIEALEQANLPYDIVPGITSAASAAAEIGVSLTARGHNKSVALITGHDAKGFAEHDWKGLAAKGGRAAVYMGVGAARFIQGRLMLHGANPNLPVSVVENASRVDQVILATTLGHLVQDIETKGIKGPAILLLGFEARKGAVHAAEKLEAAL